MKKIIILLFITAFLVSVINVYSQGPSPTPLKTSNNQQSNTTTKEQQSQKDHAISNKVLPKIDITITPSKPKENRENSTDRRDNKTPRDWWTIIPTMVIAFFAVIQGLAMIFQYRVMRQQTRELQNSIDVARETADAAKKSAEALPTAERAYLFIDSIEWKEWKSDFTLAEYNKSVVVINIINVGRTPAILGDIGAAINIKKSNYPVKEEAGKVNTINFTKGVIIKSLGIEQIYCSEVVGPSVISETDFRKSKIICYGFVRYEDIFRNSCELRFCYEFNPLQSDGRFQISQNKDLNDYT